jgi:putative toxin-antitoxin system antitoxin component (TIGR02293 family)
MHKPAAKAVTAVRGKSREGAGNRSRSVAQFVRPLPSGRNKASPASDNAYVLPPNATRPKPRSLVAHASGRPLTFERLASLLPEAREKAVNARLPATLLDEAATKLGLSKRQFLAALHIAPTSAARHKASGTLSIDDSDRIARLAQLWQNVQMVFENEQGTRAWITGRVPVLDAVPLQLLQTSQGFDRARTAILQLAYGVYA